MSKGVEEESSLSERPEPRHLRRLADWINPTGERKVHSLIDKVYKRKNLEIAWERVKTNRGSGGVDGESIKAFGGRLEERLTELHEGLRGDTFRPQPVRQKRIPKAGKPGEYRTLGTPTIFDRVCQQALLNRLEPIFEPVFDEANFGYRRGRSTNDALRKVWREIQAGHEWIVDADLRDFFDTLKHGWLAKFLEHRIADRRVIRLIQKWLNAGVLEQGQRITSEVGTVQGGSVSPLLANIYLHYVLDLWAQRWRRRQADGDLIIVRFADDFVVGFQYRDDAERFLAELRERFAKFGLDLHPDKTRLIEFGRFATQNRNRRGGGKPETFNFLGFTHICAKTRKGKFTVRRKTMRKRMQAKLKAIKIELQRRRHEPVPEQGAYVRSVVRGHARYYGVPLNGPSIGAFRQAVGRLWYRSLRRRSQKTRLTWTRMKRLIARWLPSATICHPYPLERLGVLTQGRSRMR